MRPSDDVLHFLADMLIVLAAAVAKEIVDAKCGGSFNAGEVLWTMCGGLFFSLFLLAMKRG